MSEHPGELRDMLRGATLGHHFRDAALLAAMLRFEAALARAQAHCGLVTAAAASCIERVCGQWRPDAGALARDGRRASTLAIPLVKALTDEVARTDTEAAGVVHLGATSQDVIDTALALQSRAALDDALALVDRLGEALARLAAGHRDTPMAGRTLLQPAVPITFGWKAAGWLAQLHRCRDALAAAAAQCAVLQFGGASGTLAALGENADAVAAALARELELELPSISWHSARDRVARLGYELAIMTGALAKIGRDVALLMQPEVAEAFEPEAAGRGGSSAMPHKRNPVGAMLAVEASYRATALAATLAAELLSEHERGLGAWQNSLFVLGDLFDAAGSALEAMVEVIEGLRVDRKAMLANLARSRGLVFAEAASASLAPALGRGAARALVERACVAALAGGVTLEQALAGEPEVAAALSRAQLAALFEPLSQRGAGDRMVERVLDDWRARRPLRSTP